MTPSSCQGPGPGGQSSMASGPPPGRLPSTRRERMRACLPRNRAAGQDLLGKVRLRGGKRVLAVASRTTALYEGASAALVIRAVLRCTLYRSTLAEIEAAADALPPEQKQELLLFLAGRLRAQGAGLPEPRKFSREQMAASGSATGASREILRRASANDWVLVSTPYAIEVTSLGSWTQPSMACWCSSPERFWSENVPLDGCAGAVAPS